MMNHPSRLAFRITAEDGDSRACELETPHGRVQTPAFMPVGTAGTVKGIAAWELARLAPEMVLANTYHLLLRPGVELIERLGGLHAVLGWSGPILTDSGGFQVFSLANRRRLDEDGVTFNSHIDGSPRRLSPESVVEDQARFGVDVAMVLDECLPHPVEIAIAETSVGRSIRWAERSLRKKQELQQQNSSWRGGLFAIQQGSLDPRLRRRCSDEICGLDFDGFAIGGLAVGENREELHDGISMSAPMLPDSHPRYLMGVGYPEDMLHAVSAGVDLFDCVLPTRSARTGKVFTSHGDLAMKNACHREDPRPLDPECRCPTCQVYSRAVLRHLYVSNEVTSSVLLTVHNLFFFLGLMREAREAIIAGRYAQFRRDFERKRSIGG